MYARTPQELGLAIRERRHELGLDQAELARRVGVSRQWLVEIERGKPRAEIGLVLRVLRELGLDLWLGELPDRDSPATAAIDLAQLIERARGASNGD